MKRDTIAAIATAMSNSGIGIVRISGEEAFPIIDKIYQSKNKKKKLSEVKSHTIHYGFIVDKEEVIDEVMVMCMRGPSTFTREDTVEINCHGGTLVTRKVLEAVLKNGASLAEPGEFTKRAFLNGRIDLSRAEAVIDVIHAKNDYALKSSMEQLKGNIYEEVKELRSKILYEIAFIESALDDPEHISLDGYPEKLQVVIEELLVEIDQLLKSTEKGRILKEGIRTVIVGKPNAGKSSLLNLLLGEERAIVTDIEGTTRDVLEEEVKIQGLHLNLVDTAGIRETENIVEQIGVNKTKENMKEADLIIYVVDSSKPLDENDDEIISLLEGKKVITLLNKTDLDVVVEKKDLENRLSHIIPISAKEKIGMENLEEMLKEMFFEGKISFNDQIYITNIRHKRAMEEGKESLEMVLASIADEMPEDFFTIDLMNAYEVLGSIIGESVEEDLVNEIFSRFCMGK